MTSSRRYRIAAALLALLGLTFSVLVSTPDAHARDENVAADNDEAAEAEAGRLAWCSRAISSMSW